MGGGNHSRHAQHQNEINRQRVEAEIRERQRLQAEAVRLAEVARVAQAARIAQHNRIQEEARQLQIRRDAELAQLKIKQQQQADVKQNIIQNLRIQQQQELQRLREEQLRKQQEANKRMLQIQRQNEELAKKELEIIVKPDPKQLDQLKALKDEQKAIQTQLNQASNPQNMKQVKQAQLQRYLNHLTKKDWTQELSNQFGVKHNVVMGEISAAKTSTLNFLYNLNLKTGIDQTTTHAEVVVKGNYVCIWDSPGINEEFDLMDPTTLKLFATAHRVLIFFDVSLKCSKDDVRILCAAKSNKNVYCVRTKCDKFKTPQDLQRALKVDRQLLTQWGFPTIPVYATSNTKGMDFKDNKAIKVLLDS